MKKTNFKKIISIIIIGLMLTTLFAGCSKKTSNNGTTKEAGNSEATATNQEEPTTRAPKKDVKIAVLKGATAIGAAKLMEDSDAGNASNNYIFSVHGTADEINASLIKGELDMACVPCNVASVLYNKTEGKLQVAAVNTLGVLYIIETGNTITTVSDLKGKTIYTTGQGTTPEYTLRHLLFSSGIDPDKDVDIQFKSEATEVAAMLSQADNAIAMLPQPYVTSVMINNDKARIALDVTAEWEKSSADSTVVTGVLVVRTAFAKENPELMKTFLAEYKASIDFASTNTDECATILEKYDIFKAAVAKKAMPYITTAYIDGEEMKTKICSYLTVLHSMNPAAVGGKLPGDDFYLTLN